MLVPPIVTLFEVKSKLSDAMLLDTRILSSEPSAILEGIEPDGITAVYFTLFSTLSSQIMLYNGVPDFTSMLTVIGPVTVLLGTVNVKVALSNQDEQSTFCPVSLSKYFAVIV